MPSAGHSHAPKQANSKLLIMGLVAMLLGIMFLIGRILIAPEDMELALAIERKRDQFLLWAGALLTGMGVLLILLQVTDDPNFAAGAEGELKERLANAGLMQRLLLGPRVLLAHRRARGFFNVGAQIVLATSLLILANYVLSRHELWRKDMTSDSIFSLSPETQGFVERINKDVRLIVVLPTGGSTGIKEIRTLVDQYRAANSHVTAVTVDPRSFEDDIARAKRFEELGIKGDLDSRMLMGVIVQSGELKDKEFKVEKTKRVPIGELWRGDPTQAARKGASPRQLFNGEPALTGAIIEVLDEKKPLLYFLTGHGERSIAGVDAKTGMSYLTQRLKERSYEIKLLKLFERDPMDIPPDCDVLVIAAPQNALDPREVQAIETYLGQGGKLILLDEARIARDVETGGTEWIKLGLEETLSKRYGIKTDHNWFVGAATRDKEGRPRTIFGLSTFLRIGNKHPISLPLLGSTRPLAFSGVHALQRVPALNAMQESLVQVDPQRVKYFRGYGNPLNLEDSASLQQPFELAMASERQDGPPGGKNPTVSRVVVFGDADWVSNQMLSVSRFANLELFLNSVNWCLKRERKITGEAKRPASYRLDMTKEQAERLKLLAIFGPTLLAFGLGVFTWAVRRGRG